MLHRTWKLAAVATLVTLSLSAGAAPIPTLDIGALVAKSDLIVIGRIEALSDVPGSTLQGRPGRAAAATAHIDRVLKGTPGDVTTVGFRIPLLDGQAELSPVHINSTRLLFMSRRGSGLEAADPYYPSLPARAVSPAEGGSVFERVVAAVAAVLSDPSAAPGLRVEAAQALWGQTTIAAVSALRDAVDDADRTISLGAVAALLRIGDVDALLAGEQALLTERSVPLELLHNIRVGLSTGEFGETALPTFDRLLAGADTETRRSVARSLRQMRAPAAVGILVKALSDPDVEVSYSAVMGLAEITGTNEWAPSIPVFAADPTRYTSYWREWAKRR